MNKKPSPAFAAAATMTVLLTSPLVQAKTPVSLDLDYAEPTVLDDTTSGLGGQLRFGPRLDLKVLTFDSEIALGAHFFDGSDSPNVYRGMIGPRLGILWGLRPSVFGHVGVGHVDYADTMSRTGFAADVGLALDLTVIPLIDLGVHGSWNVVAGSSQWDGYSFAVVGAHITFVGKSDDR